MKTKRNLIYILFVIVSIVSILPYVFGIEFNSKEFFKDIGINMLTACILSLIIDARDEKIRNEQTQRIRKAYLKDILNELENIIGKIILLNRAFDDGNFDWSQDITFYLGFGIFDKIPQKYNEKLTIEKANEIINLLINKYSFDEHNNYHGLEKDRVFKMFNIVSLHCVKLQKIINEMNKSKIDISSQEILTLETINELIWDIELAIHIMKSNNKNYGVAIRNLWNSFNKINKECNYCKKEIEVTYTISISFNNL